MNIFLDKSLPKKTQILLQVIRVVLLSIIFGSIYYATINPAAGDVLLYISVALAGGFFGFKIIAKRKRKKSLTEEQLNSITERTRD